MKATLISAILLSAVVLSHAQALPRHVVIKSWERLTYPRLARVARIEGVVSLTLTVGKNGAVEKVELRQGHPVLATAAIENAKKIVIRCSDCSWDEDVTVPLIYVFRLVGKEGDGKTRVHLYQDNGTPDDPNRWRIEVLTNPPVVNYTTAC